jgi:mitochondrial inner membrane protein COX18
MVVPALREARPLVERQVLHEMRVEQPRGTKEELRGMFRERLKKAVRCVYNPITPKVLTFIPILSTGDKMVVRRNELYARHRCRPWLTMLIPPLTQLPVFVGSSMFLSRLSQPPTAFDSESFLTLASLAHPDPTVALPIALGVITLANVESSRWFISTAAREQEEAAQKRVAEQRAQGRFVLEPRKIVQSGLRFLSVGRILISAVVPGVRALSLSFVSRLCF